MFGVGLLEGILGGIGVEENFMFWGMCKGLIIVIEGGIKLELVVSGVVGIVFGCDFFIIWIIEDELIKIGVINWGRVLDWVVDCFLEIIILLFILGIVTIVDINVDCRWVGRVVDVLVEVVMGLEVTKIVIWFGGKGVEMEEELIGFGIIGGMFGVILELILFNFGCIRVEYGLLLWGKFRELEGFLEEDGFCSVGMIDVFFRFFLEIIGGVIFKFVSLGGLMVILGVSELLRSWFNDVGVFFIVGDIKFLFFSIFVSLLGFEGWFFLDWFLGIIILIFWVGIVFSLMFICFFLFWEFW